MKYTLDLPLAPSINDYYGHHAKFGYCTIYIKTKGKEYRKTINTYITKNNLKLRANIPLTLSIHFTPKTRHKQDVDNILKCTLDALTKAEVWEDDSLIYKLTVEKHAPSKEKAGIIIEISKYEATNE